MRKWPIVFITLVSGVISGRGRMSGLGGSLVKMSLLIAIADYAGRFAFTEAERENILLTVK